MSFYDDVHREAMRDPVLRDQEEDYKEWQRREADGSGSSSPSGTVGESHDWNDTQAEGPASTSASEG